MSTALRTLIIEDSVADSAIVVQVLTDDGFDVHWERVATAATIADALQRAPWDIVISDFNLPGFDGFGALRLWQQSGLDCPFILVSGTIGEDTAVAAMKAGAHDYVMKGKLARLAPAVRRELADAEARRRQRTLEEKLHEEQERFRLFVEKSSEAVLLVDTRSRISYASPACKRLFGDWAAQGVGRLWLDFIHPDDGKAVCAGFASLGRRMGGTWAAEVRCRHNRARWRWFHVIATNLIEDPHVRGIVVNCRDVTARKRAEREAQDSRERMQAILDHSPALIYMKDLAGRYILTNRLFDRKFGPKNKKSLGRTVEDLQPPDVAQLRIAHDLEVLIRGEPVIREETSAESGGTRTYLAVKFPLRDAAGRISGLGGIGTDVTELKRMEAELLRRNRELSLINRVIAATNTEHEPTAVLTFACHELAQSCDLPHVAVALRDESDTVATIVADYHPSDRPSLLGTVLPVADNPVSHTLTMRQTVLIAGDAPTDPRLASVRPLLEQVGVVALGVWPLIVENHTVGSLILATDRPRSFDEDATLVFNVAREISGALGRARLNESGRRLMTAIEQSPESVMITDPAARIVYVNPAFERNSGYSSAEVLGQNPNFLKSGRHEPGFYRTLWETLTAGKAWHGRLVNKRKDGSLFTEDATIAPVHDASGAITHYVATKRDITRELRLEEQFYHAQRMDAFGQLAGGVAHDFNNILAVILLHLNLLQLEPGVSAKMRGVFDELTTAAQRAAGVTRQLLMFSRRQAMQMQTIDLNQVLTGLVKMLRRLIGENIELVSELGGDRQWIQGDPGMIEQVVMNLCVNARDAMPEGGRLVISTDRVGVAAEATRDSAPPGQYVRLQVADTGCGMDDATRQRIFEPFFTTKPVGKGTGLGLATVFGIVKQHHGWVEVESEVDHGSIFRIFLPFVEQAAPSVAATEASAPSHGTESILLVEDDACVRQVTALCLEHCGYKVTAADSGQAAFRLWEENRHEFDLLLTDVTMPGGISGLKLAEQLYRAKNSLKIIIMSGYNHGLLNSAPIPGGGVYLNKPVEAAKLMQTVRACLDARPAAPLEAGSSDHIVQPQTA